MKKWCFSIMMTMALSAQAQFVEIHDTDGYTNLRAEANTQSRVMTRIYNGRFVYIMSNAAPHTPPKNWLFVRHHDDKNQLQDGWLHHSRVRELSGKTINHTKSVRGFACTHSDVQLYVEMGKFDYAAHKKYFGGKNLNSEYPILHTYKGKTMYGTDGSIPRTAYTSMTLVQNGHRHVIAPAAFEHLFNPYFEGMDKGIDHICQYDSKRKRLYLQAWNSDGAGSYTVLFVFENGKVREVLPMDITF
ncbi:MAG: hypothetical protein Q4B82_08165 [Alysiella sp.]|uniref:hypothetical protein n=1 Tax=Alysiella sp. TaxID=1872483 RepID=UPI0026DC12D4|nr:hypothetical protein [Alysiella sp.]MDO4434535.1 hypothetical protein [Alysiella sp.]